MNEDSVMQQLHDKATRNGMLTEAEQATLKAWYKCQDAEEAAQVAVPSVPLPALAALHAEVSTATRQLNEATQRIQALSDENERLRQENVALSRHLIDRASQTASSKTV